MGKSIATVAPSQLPASKLHPRQITDGAQSPPGKKFTEQAKSGSFNPAGEKLA
jgi:hypothetical protein